MSNSNMLQISGQDIILAGSFRNFSGADTQYGPSYPFFNVKLTPEQVREAEENNMKVKYWRDENGETIAFVKVNVGKYAEVEILKDGMSTKYDPEELGWLDRVAIGRASVGLYARPWNRAGRCGFSTYLSYMFAEVEESEADKARKAFTETPRTIDDCIVNSDPPF